MTDLPVTQPQPGPELPSSRPVIEHALTDYGYSPDVARALIDRLIAGAAFAPARHYRDCPQYAAVGGQDATPPAEGEAREALFRRVAGSFVDEARANALLDEYRAAILREAADKAEHENANCPSHTVNPCMPCAIRTAVAINLRRMADEATP
jgi:hypothetical protein